MCAVSCYYLLVIVVVVVVVEVVVVVVGVVVMAVVTVVIVVAVFVMAIIQVIRLFNVVPRALSIGAASFGIAVLVNDRCQCVLVLILIRAPHWLAAKHYCKQ